MNHDEQESLAYAKHLAAEHRRVHALVSRAEQRWALAPDDPRKAKDSAELREIVEQLRDELARHFAEEDAGGVLEEAAARCPDVGREAVRLEEEHSVLLADLDHVISGTQSTGDADAPGNLKRAFQQFVDRLRAHEAAETRLLEQGFHVEMY